MRAFRSRRILVSCGALLCAFVALLAFALVASKDEARVVGAGAKPSHGGPSRAVDKRGPTTSLDAALLSLTRTADADVYVKSVARIVFGLDSRNLCRLTIGGCCVRRRIRI